MAAAERGLTENSDVGREGGKRIPLAANGLLTVPAHDARSLTTSDRILGAGTIRPGSRPRAP